MRIARSLVAAAFALLAAAAPSAARAQAAGDIVEVAQANGSFGTLLAAAEAAGLVETLKGAGPYTVFAPTDAAFRKLPAGAVDALLADRERLRAVLLYHVVPGQVTAAQVSGMSSATTVGGADVRVRAQGGSVMIGNARVTQADVAASNGVIHVIDTVLMPPMPSRK
ncbi:MAG: fasciclin domain-containing protein [Gemmatimonadota bacterium]